MHFRKNLIEISLHRTGVSFHNIESTTGNDPKVGIKITKKSLKINQFHPESIFQISPKKARL